MSFSPHLSALLELTSSAISYRQRYPTGLAPVAVRDLIALDTSNPRSLAFQVDAIAAHLSALPKLSNDGMTEEQERLAKALVAQMATLSASTLDDTAVRGIDNRLLAISDVVAARFFLRGGEPLRAQGLTLA